jgi:hypothetical protein
MSTLFCPAAKPDNPKNKTVVSSVRFRIMDVKLSPQALFYKQNHFKWVKHETNCSFDEESP